MAGRTWGVGRPRLAALAGTALLAAAVGGAALAQQGFGDPKLSEANLRQVAPHTYVIMGFPNVAFVVGDKAILVVDTGLGNANGATVAGVARKLATKGQTLILTTTHFHPEHAAGQGGFPPGTQAIRPKVQQEEMDQDGKQIMDLFARNQAMKAFMQDAALVKADTLFDREHDLDLGQVHARLLWYGAAHTRGDEIIYVPEDRLVVSGDVVQNRISPNIICQTCSPRQWAAVVDEVAKLKPDRVVPDHGELGDGALVGQERGFLLALDQRALELKKQGVPADAAGKQIQAEFEKTYAGWQGLGNIPQSVQRAYADPR
jgi:glyoxylase-like metal-dependent hydrolase (beta-lactamase superfamily II)